MFWLVCWGCVNLGVWWSWIELVSFCFVVWGGWVGFLGSLVVCGCLDCRLYVWWVSWDVLVVRVDCRWLVVCGLLGIDWFFVIWFVVRFLVFVGFCVCSLVCGGLCWWWWFCVCCVGLVWLRVCYCLCWYWRLVWLRVVEFWLLGLCICYVLVRRCYIMDGCGYWVCWFWYFFCVIYVYWLVFVACVVRL